MITSNRIMPDNRGYAQPLCPVGTVARDRWAEHGPPYSAVFETIEGGLGFWGSTQFGCPPGLEVGYVPIVTRQAAP